MFFYAFTKELKAEVKFLLRITGDDFSQQFWVACSSKPVKWKINKRAPIFVPAINKLLTYCMKQFGELDVLLSIAKLIQDTNEGTPVRYCLPNFEVDKPRPHIDLKNFWNPHVDSKRVVPNSIELGGEKKNNCIITGANSSGKSTILKAIGLLILLAQTLGVAPSEAASMTLFEDLLSCMRIEDSIGDKSLFQAEIAQMKQILSSVEGPMERMVSTEAQSIPFSFVIMDELLSSTSPDQGKEGAERFLKALADIRTVMFCMATHYKGLTELEKTKSITNYQVPMYKKGDKLERPYKLERGISDKEFATAVMEEAGVVFSRNVERLYKTIDASVVPFGQLIQAIVEILATGKKQEAFIRFMIYRLVLFSRLAEQFKLDISEKEANLLLDYCWNV